VGLVGSGFLSVLHDSVVTEDRADEVARCYLRDSGKDDNLLAEAASMLEVEDYLDNRILDQQAGVAFSPIYRQKAKVGSDANGPLFRRIVIGLRILYEFYFKEELYDYIHREAKYRRAQPYLKGT